DRAGPADRVPVEHPPGRHRQARQDEEQAGSPDVPVTDETAPGDGGGVALDRAVGQGQAGGHPPAGQQLEVPLADQVVVGGEHRLGDVGGAADDAAQLVDVDPGAARVVVEVLRQAGGLQRAVHAPAGPVDADAPVLLVDLLEPVSVGGAEVAGSVDDVGERG